MLSTVLSTTTVLVFALLLLFICYVRNDSLLLNKLSQWVYIKMETFSNLEILLIRIFSGPRLFRLSRVHCIVVLMTVVLHMKQEL